MNIPLSGDALGAFLTRAEEAADAYMRGDMALYVDLVRHADLFTLLPPNGGPVSRHKHRADTLRASPGFISDGSARLEHVETHAWNDTLVLAMNERQHGRVEGGPDRELSMRVNHVYRRECDDWRLVHRHADPLVETMTPEELHTMMSR
jgi:ketosteroid isomerase-like protein